MAGAARALLLLAFLALCNGEQWLMLGDMLDESTNLPVESNNSTISVSTSLLYTMTVPTGYRVNCVIAAAVRLNGHVRVVAGGLGREGVSIAYETIDGSPDLFYALVQSHATKAVSSVVGNSRVTLVYDRMREWSNDSDVFSNNWSG